MAGKLGRYMSIESGPIAVSAPIKIIQPGRWCSEKGRRGIGRVQRHKKGGYLARRRQGETSGADNLDEVVAFLPSLAGALAMIKRHDNPALGQRHFPLRRPHKQQKCDVFHKRENNCLLLCTTMRCKVSVSFQIRNGQGTKEK